MFFYVNLLSFYFNNNHIHFCGTYFLCFYLLIMLLFIYKYERWGTQIMAEKFKNIFNFDNKILKIIKYCFLISLLFCLISIIIMLIYNTYYISHNLYLSGIILFKTSLTIAVGSIICAIVINTIKNGY